MIVKFRIALLCQWCYVAIDEFDGEKIISALKKEGYEIDNPWPHENPHRKNVRASFSWWSAECLNLFHFYSKSLSHDNIAHEVHHAVNKICQTAGIYPDQENDEFMAYFHGWLTGKVYLILENQNVKAGLEGGLPSSSTPNRNTLIST